jgi:membrane-bound ClpP family serine protease
VRSDGLVFVDGELWHARSADGSLLAPGERVVVEAVDEESLRLTVGSESEQAEPPAVPAERT